MKVIHIEIAKSNWKKSKGLLKIQIGDMAGSTGLINATKMEVMREISDEIDRLLGVKP